MFASHGSAALLAQLDATLTQFPDVAGALYSINGSAQDSSGCSWRPHRRPSTREIDEKEMEAS